MSSEKLQDLFYMVLMAGNFLNSVGTNNEVVQGEPSPSFLYYVAINLGSPPARRVLTNLG